MICGLSSTPLRRLSRRLPRGPSRRRPGSLKAPTLRDELRVSVSVCILRHRLSMYTRETDKDQDGAET